MIRKFLIPALFTILPAAALADLDAGRAAITEGDYELAMEEFRLSAQEGDDDAEEMIGVLYAMGLGVEQDYRRAFEWYMRASIRGHAGAQSGLGWYYELGMGMPERDMVRAHMWYAISAAGGDIDAALSLEYIEPRMTAEQIKEAQILARDYLDHFESVWETD